MRICLVTPGHLVTNPRLVKEARALMALGHEITVVCGRYSAWGMQADPAIAAGLGRVISVPFGPVAASRVDYLRQSLVRHGARKLVRFLGKRARAWVEAAHHPVAPDLRAAASAVKADLYVAHYVAALSAAAAAAEKHGAVYAFDAEDFHWGDLPDRPEHSPEKSLIRTIESRYLLGAAYVTAASPLIAQAYAAAYQIPTPVTLLNLFPRASAPPAPTEAGLARPGPSLYWFSQVVGPGRGLEDAVRSLPLSQSEPHLYLRGQPASGYKDHLLGLADGLGIRSRVHFLEPVPPHQLEREGAQFDFGYEGEQAETENRTLALTNKLFSYLTSGIPVIATDIPAHRQIRGELGDAVHIVPLGSPAAIAGFVDSTLAAPGKLAELRQTSWALGQTTFAWETQIEKLANLVQTTAKTRGQPLDNGPRTVRA